MSILSREEKYETIFMRINGGSIHVDLSTPVCIDLKMKDYDMFYPA